MLLAGGAADHGPTIGVGMGLALLAFPVGTGIAAATGRPASEGPRVPAAVLAPVLRRDGGGIVLSARW